MTTIKFKKMFLIDSLDEKCGIIRDDISAILKTADLKNLILMFRSTGPYARPWLEHGYPSKNFHIKAKTSDIGFLAGLVPYDGKYSKVWWDEKAAEKGTKANEEAIEKGFAQKKTLILSPQEIADQIRNINALHKGYNEIRLISNKNGTFQYLVNVKNTEYFKIKEFYFTLKALSFNAHQLKFIINKHYSVYISEKKDDPNPKEVFVMCDIKSNNNKFYITGDYDLFNICPLYNDFGLSDKPQDNRLNCIGSSGHVPWFSYKKAEDNFKNNPTLQNLEKLNRFIEILDPNRIVNGIGYGSPLQEDKNMGNITLRIKDVVENLTENLEKVYKIKHNKIMRPSKKILKNTRVHHNAEAYNPFADKLENCFPIAFFLPIEFFHSDTIRYGTIRNKSELDNFREYIFRKGYYFPINKKWDLKSHIIKRRKEIANKLGML